MNSILKNNHRPNPFQLAQVTGLTGQNTEILLAGGAKLNLVGVKGKTKQVTQHILEIVKNIRQLQGSTPVEYIVHNAGECPSIKNMDKQNTVMLARLPDDESVIDNPLVKSLRQQGAIDGLVVSKDVHYIIESKVNTAKALGKLKDPTTSQEIIDTYLKNKGITDQETIDRIVDLSQQVFPETGIIENNLSKEKINQELKVLLKEFQNNNKGIVFQIDNCDTGNGTLILSAEEINKILENTPENQLTEKLSEMMHFTQHYEGTLAQDIQKKGISWQEKVENFEQEYAFVSDVDVNNINPQDNFFKPAFYSEKFVKNGKNHIGNKIRNLDTCPISSETLTDLNLLHEIVFDVMLKDADIQEGVKSLFDKDSEHSLYTFGTDIFVKKDGTIVISEYNARPIASKRSELTAHAIDPHIDHKTPVIHLTTTPMRLSKSILDELEKQDPQKISEFLNAHFSTELARSPQAKLDSVIFDLNPVNQTNEDHFEIKFLCLFPYPTQDGVLERDIMDKISDFMQKMTAEDLKECRLPSVENSNNRMKVSQEIHTNKSIEEKRRDAECAYQKIRRDSLNANPYI